MKFYLDEDLSPRIAEALRRHRLDAVSAHEAGNHGIADREQLAFARGQQRCLVTRNGRHFVELAREAIQRQQPHAGIVICPSRVRGDEVGRIAVALTRLAERYPEGLGDYDVVFL